MHFQIRTPLLCLLLSPFLSAAEDAVPVGFNADVQPILSAYCYHCHGPDSGTRAPKKAPLRLDRAEYAFEERETLGGPVIVKGDPAASELVRRIKSDDPDELMPPAESHKTMKPEEIAILEQWIAQGATYEEHWAFIPPSRPDLPPLPDGLEAWVQNPVDAFVAARLAAEGLEPNPVEAPRRFLRRLTFDLTGLPPTPEDLDRFETAWHADPNNAVDTAVTRLLASPAYGEHYGRHWLDAARYSDTHGIHIDNYRAIWPYRDWVINAFNRNMPFDQFTVEQIAGDLLPEATLDQVVATGFNRCLATTGEGGAISEEYDAIYAQDRTNTTAAVWLGLTAGCAACHDHKFDPISTRDTYSFNAFFRNTTMNAMDGNSAEHPPNVFVPSADDRARWHAVDGEIAATRAALQQRRQDGETDFQQWITAAATDSDPSLTPPTPDFHLLLASGDNEIRGVVAGEERQWPAEIQKRDGPLGPAPLVSSAQVPLGDFANLSAGSPFSYGALVYIEGTPSGALIARMDNADNYRGWDLWLQQGKVGAHIIQQWPEEGSKAVTATPLPPGQWHHVLVTFDPDRPANEKIAVYVDGARQEVQVEKAALPAKDVAQIGTNAPLILGSRHGGDAVGPTAALQDFRLYHRLLNDAEIDILASASSINAILARPAAERTPENLEALRNHYFANVDARSRELNQTANKLEAEKAALRSRGSLSLVMQEKPDSEPFAHILTRGEYNQKAEKVAADVPEVLPDLPEDAPRNRLGLARWLVDRENPLSARVTANRTWYYIFGRGIVETTEDFGIMGSRPSHPQLLDWLAVEFMESGWDYQHLLRTIVSSATYRQAQTIGAEKLETDPLNILLARGPRYRLEAEEIRDLALAASGLLVPKIGGPPVKPYQPDGIWSAVAMKESNTRNYEQDSGENLYRRSLYTFHKRTAPPASMDIFNAPTREVFCVRRERTNTPLQAFVTMNDVQFVEAARQLAILAMHSVPEPDARLDLIYLRLLSRKPDAAERPILDQTLQKFLDAYRADPEAAKELIAIGDSPADPTLDPAELAAWTLLASSVLNLDETLTK